MKTRIGEWEESEGWDYLVINEYSNGRALYNPLTNKYVFLDNQGIEKEEIQPNNFYKTLQLKTEIQADTNYTKACHIEAKMKKDSTDNEEGKLPDEWYEALSLFGKRKKKDLTEKENKTMKKKISNNLKPTGKWVATIYTANNYQSLGDEEVVLFRSYEDTKDCAIYEIEHAIETYFDVCSSFRVEIIQNSN